MIAAQHQRNLAGLKRRDDKLSFFGAGVGDFFQVLGVRIARRLRFGQRDRHVAFVFDDVAQRLELAFEAGDADCRGAHINATARLTEIERHADDANLLRVEIL